MCAKNLCVGRRVLTFVEILHAQVRSGMPGYLVRAQNDNAPSYLEFTLALYQYVKDEKGMCRPLARATARRRLCTPSF